MSVYSLDMPDEKPSRKRKPGRPLAGTAPDGTPERVTDYTKITILMKPATKARLDALATLLNAPTRRVVDELIGHYIEHALNPEDRKAVESMVRAIEKRAAK